MFKCITNASLETAIITTYIVKMGQMLISFRLFCQFHTHPNMFWFFKSGPMTLTQPQHTQSHTFPSKRFLSLFLLLKHMLRSSSFMWLRQRNQEAKSILIFSLSFRLLWFIFLMASKVSQIHCRATCSADLLARPLNLCLSYFHSDVKCLSLMSNTHEDAETVKTYTYTDIHTTRRVRNMGILQETTLDIL